MWQESHRQGARLLAVVSLGGLLLGVSPSALVAPPPWPPTTTHRALIRERDTFVIALLREGLDRATAHRVIRELREFVDFTQVRPGDTIETVQDRHGTVLAVAYQGTPWERYEVWRRGERWAARQISIPAEVRVEALSGTIRSSLFHSMEALGESPQLVLKFVEIFAWDFDFAADSWPDDGFRLLVEKRHADGKFVEYGKILVAEYEHEGSRLTGIAFTTRDGRTGYYDPRGRSMRKSFLRSPLQFTRITSGYSFGRRHPVLGGVRPHLAIDYAAPTGTPVRTVADGVVRFAGWKRGGYGISVMVKHRSGYETMYNHLSRLRKGIRRGRRVEQGQIIGYVGSTGLSTGPHLDYRVKKHGRFVNPLAEEFVPGDPVPSRERAAFIRVRDAVLKRLEREAPFLPSDG
ncbi:MAG: peptidoglycan DD-metalloendopeptidase family protein [Candidatus Methylomirabilia bacterium]